MFKNLLSQGFALLLLPFLAMPLQAQEFVEGQHYSRLQQTVRTQDPSKVEVVEVFGYWCPHCNDFERYMNPWKETLSESVDLKHLPVVFSPKQAEFAKAYYVSVALGVEQETHPALFSLIHQQRSWINTREQLGAFFVDFGVSEADFNRAYGSFALNTQLSLGKKKATEYKITGVPSMIVNGKYVVTAGSAGSQKAMLDVVDYLVAQEQETLK
ncbi:MAG: thiol:disulfide interchange protein DsbA [Motiliproteus sp.]|jgi:thiol:disulfide interchange protein DsbA